MMCPFPASIASNRSPALIKLRLKGSVVNVERLMEGIGYCRRAMNGLVISLHHSRGQNAGYRIRLSTPLSAELTPLSHSHSHA